MTKNINRIIPKLTIALIVASSLPLTARADGMVALQVEVPRLDIEQPLKAATRTAMLNGSVYKRETSLRSQEADGDQQNPEKATRASESNFQPEVPKSSIPSPYALAIKKLAAGGSLNSDEYRSLGVGILGYDADRQYFKKEAKITELYPGCPAAEAGMRLGDRILDANAIAEDSKVVDPTIPSWIFASGKEGQTVDLTVKRHGHLLAFHLTRMNMEDTPDPKVRLRYEELVQRLGAHEEGVAVPKSLLDELDSENLPYEHAEPGK